MSDGILGWHLLRYDMTAGHGNEPAWRDGEERTCDGTLSLCGRGYHASRRLIDALGYASGSAICRVRLGGDHLKGYDKCCARTRRLLWHLSAEQSERLLHEFACWQLEQAIMRNRASGSRPAWWTDADEKLAAAVDVAFAAARDDAWVATQAAQNAELTRRVIDAHRMGV